MSLSENFAPFIEALENSIATENWYSALIVAATIPDICCSVDGTKPDVKNARSRTSYIKWFDKYIKFYNVENYDKVYLNGVNAYALRCDILHDGAGEIDGHIYDSTLGYKRIEFFIEEPRPSILERLQSDEFKVIGADGLREEAASFIDNDGVLFLNPRVYCKLILNAMERWLDEYEGNQTAIDKSKALIKIAKQ